MRSRPLQGDGNTEPGQELGNLVGYIWGGCGGAYRHTGNSASRMESRDERQASGTPPNLGNVFECPIVKFGYAFRLMFLHHQQRRNHHLPLLYGLIDSFNAATTKGYIE